MAHLLAKVSEVCNSIIDPFHSHECLSERYGATLNPMDKTRKRNDWAVCKNKFVFFCGIK